MMYRKYMVLIVVLLLLSLMLVPISAVQAQDEGFSESFDDPALPGWEKSGEDLVTNGVLRMTAGNFALHFGDWSEITLAVKVNFSGDGQAVINYYFRDEGRYALSLNPGHVFLEKERNQRLTMLDEADVPGFQPDTWHNIRVVVSGGEHQVFINEEPVLSASDPEPLETGAILLQVLGEMTAEFDDLDVRGVPGVEPLPDEGAAAIDQQPPPQPTVAQTAVSPGTDSAPGDLIQEFFASQSSTVDLITFLINLILAVVCAYILSLVYIHWGWSLSNRRRFAANFMLLTITTTFIILVVRSSVALSLGLVGALSIVRFRTAVKETEELAFLFVSIGIGIGLGDNQRLITLVALAVVVVIVGLRRIFRRLDADVNLHMSVASRNPHKVELEEIMAALQPSTAKLKLIRFDETADSLEAAFLVEFGRMDKLTEAKSALRALSESIEITFLDNKGIW